MEPTQKSEAMETFLANVIGSDRRESIKANVCIPAPMGCGREIPASEIETWDALTQKEYTISGWCKTCQDKIYFPDNLVPDEDGELEQHDLSDYYGDAFREAAEEMDKGIV